MPSGFLQLEWSFLPEGRTGLGKDALASRCMARILAFGDTSVLASWAPSLKLKGGNHLHTWKRTSQTPGWGQGGSWLCLLRAVNISLFVTCY